MSTVLISQELFNNISFDSKTNSSNSLATATGEKEMDNKPTALVVFANSDINAAIYHLIKSMNSPFDPQAIATVLVQEAIKQDFIEKLLQQSQFYSFNKIKSQFYNFNNIEKFNRAVETAQKLNAQFIILQKNEEDPYQHCMVCDFSHEQLGSTTPSGIVTLHTFRTAKEAINLINKESLQFTNTSIWQENHGHAYELVSQLKSNNFFINCHLVPLVELEESINLGRNYVMMDNAYHYETLKLDGKQKNIVFPIGSIFAN